MAAASDAGSKDTSSKYTLDGAAADFLGWIEEHKGELKPPVCEFAIQ